MLMVAHLTFLVAAALVVLFLNAHISHLVHTNTDSFIPLHFVITTIAGSHHHVSISSPNFICTIASFITEP